MVAYALQFGKDWNSKGQSSYENSWSASNPDEKSQTWDIKNFNNNNNGWAFVKGGNSSKALISTITTAFEIPEIISSVDVTMDALTSSKVNSIYLTTSADPNFANGTEIEKVTVTPATGVLSFKLTEPAANLYYRLSFDLKIGKASIQVSKVEYKVVDGPQDYTFFEEKEYTVEVGKTIALGVEADAPKFNFTFEPEGIATIADNTIKGVAAGTTNVIASWSGDDSWNAGTAKFPVTVIAPLQEATIVATEIASADLANTTTLDIEYEYEGAETPVITATSSAEDVVTVASVTDGNITLNLVGKGTSIITITATADGFTEVSAACVVTLTDSRQPTEITFDFNNKTYEGLDLVSGNSAAYQKDVTIADNGVTLRLCTTTGSGMRHWTSSPNQLRVYTGNFELTAIAPDGYVVTSIKCSTSKVPTWTGSEKEAKVTVALSSRTDIDNITVNLAKEVVSNVATPTFNLVEGDYGYTLEMACETEGAKIYYTEDGSEPTAESTLYVNPVEVWGTPTIKAVAINEAGDASAVASFSEAIPYLIDSFMPLSDFPDGTAVTVKATMTVVYQNGAYLYVQDANGSGMLLYGTTDATYANGDTFSVLKGTYTVFNGLPEITGYVISDVTAGTPVEPRNASLAYATTMLNSYVKIENVSVVNNTITDIDGNKVVLYDRFKLATILTGENIDIIGFFGYYIAKDGKESAQFYPVEMTATPAPDQAPILIGGSEFQGDRLELDYAMEVTFPAIEGHSVWYKLTAITTEPAENDIEAYAEVDEEGYTRYEGAFNVDPTLHNSLSYYVQNDANGMRSEVRTLAVGISTGVSLIEAEEAEAEYFNLQGIRVDRPAEGGVYLRRIGSKVVKVIK